MYRHIAANALTLLIVATMAVGVLVLWAKTEFEKPSELAQAMCVTVPSGTNMTKVSENLQEQEAITNATIFRIGSNYLDKSNQLKAGAYIVPAGSSMGEIVDIVTRGGQSTCGTEIVYRIGIARSKVEVRGTDPETGQFIEQASFDPAEDADPEAYSKAREDENSRYRVLAAEGVTSWQVAEALKGVEFLTGELSEVPPEGSLAPDSYEVRSGDTVQSLIARMQNAQASNLEEAWLVRDPETPLKTREEALILASIIEKETGLADERPQVASVFVNRLNKGMMLQTDPTVIYGITLGQGSLGRGLRRSELDRKTPYNTYKIEGLPPTPIANPGKAAIEAVLNPADTDFIFFVADGTGGHAFAQTLDEHNSNVAKWREIEKQRAQEAEGSSN